MAGLSTKSTGFKIWHGRFSSPWKVSSYCSVTQIFFICFSRDYDHCYNYDVWFQPDVVLQPCWKCHAESKIRKSAGYHHFQEELPSDVYFPLHDWFTSLGGIHNP